MPAACAYEIQSQSSYAHTLSSEVYLTNYPVKFMSLIYGLHRTCMCEEPTQ